MCVIIGLTKNQVINEAKLKNAVLNNPHGFGLVTTNAGKLEVYHKFDERGNNPEVVARELEKRKDAEMRYLHVRYCTRGDKSRENTQPFTVFKSKDRRIEFMHNGSLSNKHTVTPTGITKDFPSDTRLFAQQYLSPMLYHYSGDNGFGDIEDVFLEKMFDDFFSYTNRGLLIANDLDPMFLGKWETLDLDDKSKAIVSNTDYFSGTQTNRMTEFYKPKMTDMRQIIDHHNKKEEESSDTIPLGTAGASTVKTGPAPTSESTVSQSTIHITTKDGGSTGMQNNGASGTSRSSYKERKITPLKEVDLKKHGRFLLPSDIDGLMDVTTGELDDELISYIAMLSLVEFRNYVDVNPDGASRLLEHIFLKSSFLIDENEDLADKHDRATSRIAHLTSLCRNAGVTYKE